MRPQSEGFKVVAIAGEGVAFESNLYFHCTCQKGGNETGKHATRENVQGGSLGRRRGLGSGKTREGSSSSEEGGQRGQGIGGRGVTGRGSGSSREGVLQQ